MIAAPPAAVAEERAQPPDSLSRQIDSLRIREQELQTDLVALEAREKALAAELEGLNLVAQNYQRSVLPFLAVVGAALGVVLWRFARCREARNGGQGPD